MTISSRIDHNHGWYDCLECARAAIVKESMRVCRTERERDTALTHAEAQQETIATLSRDLRHYQRSYTKWRDKAEAQQETIASHAEAIQILVAAGEAVANDYDEVRDQRDAALATVEVLAEVASEWAEDAEYQRDRAYVAVKMYEGARRQRDEYGNRLIEAEKILDAARAEAAELWARVEQLEDLLKSIALLATSEKKRAATAPGQKEQE